MCVFDLQANEQPIVRCVVAVPQLNLELLAPLGVAMNFAEGQKVVVTGGKDIHLVHQETAGHRARIRPTRSGVR